MIRVVGVFRREAIEPEPIASSSAERSGGKSSRRRSRRTVYLAPTLRSALNAPGVGAGTRPEYIQRSLATPCTEKEPQGRLRWLTEHEAVKLWLPAARAGTPISVSFSSNARFSPHRLGATG